MIRLGTALAGKSLVFAAGAVLLMMSIGSAHADVFLDQTFDNLPDGDIPTATTEQVWQWSGPDNTYGSVKVTGDKFAGNAGKSAAFFYTSPENNKGPTLNVDWSSKLSSSDKVKNSVEWQVMVPKTGSFLGLCYVGTGWGDSAAIVIFENGQITLEYGATERTSLGNYEAGKWNSLKVVVDPTTKTLNVFVDDKEVGNGYAWRKADKTNLGHLCINASTGDLDHLGNAVLYVDNIRAASLP